MSVRILTLNAGSTSVKFALYDGNGGEPAFEAGGQVEELATTPHLIAKAASGAVLEDRPMRRGEGGTHEVALKEILEALNVHFPDLRVAAVGHRVVHGGPSFSAPTVASDEVIAELERLAPLAPLHQPHNLAGIAAAKAAFPDALQVVCFDTAFHRAHPWVNDTFALPRDLFEKGIRRYGFHGLSYEYLSCRLRQIDPVAWSGRVVLAHLGAGASMCAVRGGKSITSTMGFSAVDGLPMATRCGQLDPAVVLYLIDQEGMTTKQVADLLYKQSGLKGLSGLSGDMRDLLAAKTVEAERAIDYFVFRIRRELGALAAALGGIDALVFSGGIGENVADIRTRVCEDLHWIGLDIDEERNRSHELLISTHTSPAKIFVMRTHEEAMIAHHTLDLLRERSGAASAR